MVDRSTISGGWISIMEAGLADNLIESVIDHLHRQIFVTHALAQGDRINEREISRTLNISRAPVREAFRALEQQGIITSVKYKGWAVTEFNEERAAEVNKIRTLLEGFLFETAIRLDCYSDEDLAEAERLNEEMALLDVSASAADQDDQLYLKEMEFHLSLYGIAKDHCELARKLLHDLAYQIRLSLTFTDNLHKRNFLAYSVRVHRLVLKYLKEKNLGGIREMMERRLDKNKKIDDLLRESGLS